MNRSFYFVLFIFFFDLVNAHSNTTTDKGHEAVKKQRQGPESSNDDGTKMIEIEEEIYENEEELSANDKNENDGNEEDINADYGNDDENEDELGADKEDGDENDEEPDDDYGNDDKNDDEDDQDGYDYGSQGGSQNDEPKDDDARDSAEQSKESKFETRSLQSGDTFTPFEMLPISTKLLNKVSTPGEGRGIVSSAKSPEDLADKLFAAYFLTRKRIVYLTEMDLSGLDALQALALEGEVVKMRSLTDSITEPPVKTVNFRGQLIGIDESPRRCHYKLISKKVTSTKDGLRSGGTKIKPFKKILKLEKMMKPNRHLIVHYARKSNKEKQNLKTNADLEKEEDVQKAKKQGDEKKKRNKIARHKKNNAMQKKGRKRKTKLNRKLRQKNRGVKRNKKLKQRNRDRKKENSTNLSGQNRLRHKKRHSGILTTTLKPFCKWRYICKDPGDLDSCRLHTSCHAEHSNTAKIDNEYPDYKGKERNELVLQFRKMLGITALDEEVEKIIEQHVLLVKPENMKTSEKIETLDEYFNSIIMAQHLKGTPPTTNIDDEDKAKQSDQQTDKESSEDQNPMQGQIKKTTLRQELEASSEYDEMEEELRGSQKNNKLGIKKQAKGIPDAKLRVRRKSTTPTIPKATKKIK